MDIFYAVNARIPNDKAHGIQIAKTCEALGQKGNRVLLILAGKSRINEDIFTYYNLHKTFNVIRLPVLDISHFGHVMQFILRSGSFYVLLYPYLFGKILWNLIRGIRSALYVRGEAILALAPIFFWTCIVWESHTLRGHKRLYKSILPLLTGMVVITDKYKIDLVATGRISASKIVCARDAVDIEEFDITTSKEEARTLCRLPQQKTIILYTGQLSAHKGVDTLLESAAFLSDNHLVLIVGGSDTQVASYRAEYSNPGIQFVGQIRHTDIPLYLKAADILVLPDSAHSEYGRLHTSPMKMFEYMASQRPIIASRVSSLSEVLNEKNAMMFIPDNAEDLAAHIKKLTYDTVYGGSLAREAYELVQQFSWSRRAEIIDTFIKELL